MSRILVFLLALALLAACGKGDEEQARGTSDEPVSMIPGDELSEYEKIANAHIRPYFDGDAKATSKSVAPGETFDVYVFGEYNELYPMSAAEYRLVLPEGVAIMASTETDSTILSMGKPDNDFMIAFRCSGGPKMMLVKYQCRADEAFTGGTIATEKGADMNFIGFTMCDATRTLVRARGGQAELKKK